MVFGIRAFEEQFNQDLMARAQSLEVLQEEAFFSIATDVLIECGELSEANYSQHRKTGIQVNGYGGDPRDENGTLNLILLDYHPETEGASALTTADATTLAKRGMNFLAKVRTREFVQSLEESSDVFGLAILVGQRWSEILRIRLVILSNKVLSSRFDLTKLPTETIGGDTPVQCVIWDLQRFGEYATQTSEREPLFVDFDELGHEVPVLSVKTDVSAFESYLAVFPGQAIADLYERHGTRLLEQNVRVFLQARGKVNKGIQATILDEPEMFFAYNNGLTATVEEIEVVPTEHGLRIQAARNLQIVNGGQTAASIHLMSEYSKKRWSRGWSPDLSQVFVQAKVSVVPPDEALDVVPRISRFANSQNKVNDADFFSSHPFHVAIEQMSTRMVAPPKPGALVGTRWFYERMRGQYQNTRNRLFGARLKEFDTKTPRSQVFTKTDLAKYLMPWEGKPEIAQRGAAKCFMEFASDIGAAWDRDQTFCNDVYYQAAVAKAILFKRVEWIVSHQPWYEGGGNRAPIVIHTLGKLASDMIRRGRSIDFERIWREQSVYETLESTLVDLTTEVKDCILFPPTKGQLPTEWGKQQACTAKIAAIPFNYTRELFDSTISTGELADEVHAAKRDRQLTVAVSAEIFVAKQGPLFWTEVRAWGQSRGFLNPKDVSILRSAERGLPSERQASYIYRLWQRLERDGCPLSPPDP